MLIATAHHFIQYLRAKNSSIHTLRNYAIDLNSFKSYLEEQLPKPPPEAKKSTKIHYQFDEDKFACIQGDHFNLKSIDRSSIRGYLASQHEQKQKNAP